MIRDVLLDMQNHAWEHTEQPLDDYQQQKRVGRKSDWAEIQIRDPVKLNGIELMESFPLYDFSAKIQPEKTLGQLRLHANLCSDKKTKIKM